MKIVSILIATLALPLMALGQDQSQADQGKKKEQQEEQAPPKKKKAHTTQEVAKAPAKAETSANMHQRNKTEGHAKGAMKTERSGPASTRTHTKVNKDQFRSSHTEVFNLGRHPKNFFIQRYGANHFRLIGNTYFVFVDGCWVAVDVAGFTFVQRVICEGDPDYIVVY